MAAIISGNGLGLFNSSLNQLGGALGSLPGLGQGRTSQYVNVATGNLVMQGDDEHLVARGMTVAQLRTYNSRGVLTSASQGGVDCWTFGFETSVRLLSGVLNTAGSVVERTLGDGTRTLFAWDEQAQAYASADGDGAHDRIVRDGSRWLWTEGSSLRQEEYDTDKGLLRVIRDLKSGTENVLERNTNGLLQRVMTQGGDGLVFKYDGTGYSAKLLELQTLEGGITKSQVRYGYDSLQRLARIEVDLTPGTWADNATDSTKTFVTTYEYADDTPKIKRASRGFSQSDGFEVSYDYYTDGPHKDKIKTVIVGSTDDGSAQRTDFSYDDVNRATSVTDGAGRTWTYKYDAKGQIVEILSPAEDGLRQVTKCFYDDAGNVTQIIDAEDRSTVYKYDSRGNVILQRDNAGNTIDRTYDANNQLLTEVRYTAPDLDGEGAQQPSGALTTRYVYDDRSRLAYVIEPQGEVTKYTYATNGLVESILKFPADSYVVTGLTQSQAPSKVQMDAWSSQIEYPEYQGAEWDWEYDMGPRPTPASANVTRSDFSYDARGLVTSRTSYAKVDEFGQGVWDEASEVTQYVYDLQGLLVMQQTNNADTAGKTMSYVYDGLGRLLSTTDADNNTTTWIYDDVGQRLLVRHASGLLRTEAFDKAGRTLVVTESASDGASVHTARRYYDNTGRLRATEDANGARTYYFYDEAGRTTGEVDVTGAVTEYYRDDTGLLEETRYYAARVDTRSWLVNGSVLPQRIADILPVKDNATDRVIRHGYDAAGRLTSDTDAEGVVTQYTYDGASRLLATTVSRPGDADSVPRVTRYFYDDSGHRVATLDADGYLIEHRFDAAGREIATVKYANLTPASQRASGSLTALRPFSSPEDEVTRHFYNGRHLKVGELNAEGYLTEFVYDETLRQRGVRTYKSQLTGLAGTESFHALKAQAEAGGARETRRTFDARGLLELEVNAEGTAIKYYYDAAGRVIRTEASQNVQSEVRNNHQWLDVFGNLIGEISAEGAEKARTLLLGGKHLNDTTLAEHQRAQAYAAFGIVHRYDVLNRRIESVDCEGNKTWYFYDAAGRLIQSVRGVTDANGVKNAEGEVTETRYSTFGDVLETIAYTGRISVAAPFDRAQVASAVSVLQYVAGRDTRNQFEYDRRGLLTARVDAENFRTTRHYNAFGEVRRETRQIDAQRSVTNEYWYDRRGYVVETVEDTNGLARLTSQNVDGFGRLRGTVDAQGNYTYFGYDRLGRQTTRAKYVKEVGDIDSEFVWSTSYDAFDRVVTQTNPLNETTTYRYDDDTRGVVVTTHEGVTMRTERNRHGETVKVVVGLNNTTVYRYNLDGALVETQLPDLPASHQDYDKRGLLIRSADASGRVVGYKYDAVGRVLERIEDPDGLALVTRYAYDGQGRQVLVSDAASIKTRMRYDANGQLEEVVADEGGLNLTTTYTWDGLGRQLTVTEGAGTLSARTVAYEYDNLGRRTKETLAPSSLNLQTVYEYDLNDNLIRRTDAQGRVTRFAYDGGNRLIFEVDGEGGVNRTWYDAAGRVVATRRYAQAIDVASLPEIATQDDINDRLTLHHDRDLQSYNLYDHDGRLSLAVNGAGEVAEFKYDAANRLVETYRYATAAVLDDALRAQLQVGGVDLANFAKPAVNVHQDLTDYRVYDAAGRVRHTVDALGNVQELHADPAGRALGSTRYVTPIAVDSDLRTMLASGTATPDDIAACLAERTGTADDIDLRSYQVFDGAGRLRFAVDSSGSAVQYYVDELGRSVGSRQYAAPIGGMDSAFEQRLATGEVTVDEIKGRLHADEARDLRSYHVLDTLGRVRFSVDAMGAVQGFDLDATGNITGSRRYANTLTVNADLLASLCEGTVSPDGISDLLTDDDARDVRTLQLLDDAGRVRLVVDANGAVQETRYDAAGLVVQQVAYAATLSLADRAAIAAGTLGLDGLNGWLTQHSVDARTTTLVHDAAGRLRYVLSRESATTAAVLEYRYDGARQRVAEVAYGKTIPAGTVASVNAVAEAIGAAGADAPSAQRMTRSVFDAAGRLRFSIDSHGAVTEQRFDGAGRAFQTRSYDQRVPATATTEAAVIAALIGSGVRTTTTTFDAAGRVQVVTDALNHAESFEYDGAGQKTAYTNRDQHRWTYSYDAAGRLVCEVSPQVRVAEVAADGRANTTLRSIVTRIEYDALGNVVARIEDADAPASARRTEYTYDSRGRQTVTTFPATGSYNTATGQFDPARSPTTKVIYDTLDRAVVQKDVRGFYSYRVYDSAGQLRFEVDQGGYVTGYTYNSYGEQFTLTRYAQAIAITGEEPITLAQMQGLLQANAAADRTLTTQYSSTGQKIEVQQDQVSWYDSAGVEHQGRPTTRFEYDTYGQLIRESVLLEGDANAADARWAHTVRFYDAVGRQSMVVDAEGNLTAFTYSAQGEVLQQVEYARAFTGAVNPTVLPAPPAAGDATTGYNRITEFTYDALGRKETEVALRHETDHNGLESARYVETRIAYDGEGHALTMTVDGETTTTAYDALGRASTVLEQARDVLRTDAEDQLRNAAIGLGDAALKVRTSPYSTMLYDAFGNVVEVRRFASGWVEGSPAPADSATDQVHTTRYDRQGRSVWERDAAGTEYQRMYDEADNLVESRMVLEGNSARWADIVTKARYDALGRQVSSAVVREKHIGSSAVLESITDTASFVRYNAFGEIVAKADDAAWLDDTSQSLRYTYDRAGRLTASNAESGMPRSYGYNLAGHQTREAHETRLGATFEGVAYTTVVTLSETDRLGRTTRQTMPAGTDDASATVTVRQRYDRWGNVLEVVDPRNGRTTYQYNELNQAVVETRPEVKVVHADGTEAIETPTTHWFYDALGRLLATRDANGNTRRNYYDNAGQLIESRDGASGRLRYGYDALGQQRLTEDALGYVTFRAFDTAGRVIEQGDLLTSADQTIRERTIRESYALDANGNRLRVTDALGNTAQYDYDSRGLVVRSRTAAGVVMEYAYDAQGRKIRETNALSDGGLLFEPRPVYRGGLPEYVSVQQGQAWQFTVPMGMFDINTGDALAISERVIVEVLNQNTQQYQAVTGWQFDAATRVLSGTPTEAGIYRISVIATAENGTFATATMGVSSISSAYWTQYGHDQFPVATIGLRERTVAAGEFFQITLPAGAFVDPQGQGLSYSWHVLEKYTYRVDTGDGTTHPRLAEDGATATSVSGTGSGYEVEAWKFVPLAESALAGHLNFDPATGTLWGALPTNVAVEMRVEASDPNGHTAGLSVSVGPRPADGTAPARRRGVDDQEGKAIYLDEQTWAYDQFGRLADHNDLSGTDYDYEYDARTGQQVRQSSGWTEANRIYSTPVDDYFNRIQDDFLRNILREWYRQGRNDLALPTPELIHDPARELVYYANGQLKEIREGRDWTRYAYDASGNRTMEESLTRDASGQVMHLRTNIAYDSHNRIIKVTQDDLGANRRLLDLRYDYDAVGNRRRVLARGAYGTNQTAIPMTDLPPEVAQGIGPQSALIGEQWSFEVPAGTFRDPEGSPLAYRAGMTDGSALPPWLKFNSVTHTFTGTPPGAVSLSLRVTVTDMDGRSVSTDFTFTSTENQPPVVSGSITTQTAYVGVPWSFQVPAGAFTDPDGRPLRYSATLADGSPLPEWMQLSADGRFTGMLPQTGSPLSVRVIATDSAGASVSVDFELERKDNPPPFNLDFELGDLGWNRTGINIVNEPGSYGGGWHAKRVYTGGSTAGISSVGRLPVQPGENLTLSVMMRAYGADDQVGGQVRIVWLDANGAMIGHAGGNEVNVVNGYHWRPSSVTAEVPVGAAYAMFQADSFCLRAGGVVLFDQFSWSRAAAQPTLAENLTFEQGDTGWDKGTGWTIGTGEAYAGQWAARLETVGISSITNQTMVPVQAGVSYTASMMVSARNDSAAELILSWYDANGQFLSFQRGNLVKTNGWGRSSVTGAPPQGAAFLRIGCSARIDGGEGPVVLDQFTLVQGAVSGGGGGGGGGGGIDDGGPIQQQSLPGDYYEGEFPREDGGGWVDPDIDDAYNSVEAYKTYWYAYDGENRVSVVHGQLQNGEIVIGNADISHALSYDEAGRATMRHFYQGGGIATELTQYDQRGQRMDVYVNGVRTESYRYDAVGRTLERREHFTAGTISNGIDIGGWLKHAEVFSYDADGRVLRQDIRGRMLGWTAYVPPPPPQPTVTSSGPGAPALEVPPGMPAAGFTREVAGEFVLPAQTFVDAERDAIAYTMTAAPAWLQYETLADGSHRFFGTPPAGAMEFAERNVTLRATDAAGNWTEVTFTIWIEGDGGGIENPDDPPGTVPRLASASATRPPETDDVNVLSYLGIVHYGESAYDRAGRLTVYRYSSIAHEYGSGARAEDPINYTHTYVYQYEGRDGYLERQVFGRSNNTNFRASNTTSQYDAWGRRIGVREQTPKFDQRAQLDDRVRYFAYDREGNILQRREGTLVNNVLSQTTAQAQQNQLYAYVGGQQVASGKRTGELDVVGRLTAYSSSEAGAISITVQAGDTLRSIAQRIYGNANLWYVIAEANAVTDEQLVAGTSLKVPEVKVTANDANTFKPYNPNEVIGNTTPSLPYITPPPKQNCNVLAMILIIVVVVVVTVFTAGAAAPAAATTATGLTAATGASTMALGASVLAGTAGVGFGTSVAIGALAGAAGALAGQALGSALGVSSFSWRNVAAGAVTGALTAGLASQFGTVGAAANAGNWGKAAALAVGTAGAGYAGQKVAGINTSFSWRSIAASAVSSVVSAGISRGVGLTPEVPFNSAGSFAADLANGMIGGVVSLHTRRAFGFDDDINYGNIAADAFGNALGNAAVGGIQKWQDSRRIGPVERQEIEQPNAELVIDDVATEITPPSLALNVDPATSASSATSTQSRSSRTPTRSEPDFSNVVAGVSSTEPDNVTTLETVTVVGTRPRDMNLDDLAGVLRLIASGPRQNVSKGVRLFDRDALDYAEGSFGGRVRAGAEFDAREALRAQLQQADANSRGNAQLVMLVPEGMSDYDKLVNAIRAGGGYISEEVGQNLLDQINSGADAIDLTYARAQSEGVLNALQKGSDFLSLNDALSYNSNDTGVLGVEMHNARKLAEYRAFDRLLPAELTITERGVQREVDRAFALASTLGGIPELAAMPLMLARGLGAKAIRPGYLTSSEFARLPERGMIDPRVIRYSQDNAGPNFKPPYGSVEDFAQQLRSGGIDPATIKPVRIVERDGSIFTLDNRRLYGFERAGVNIPYQKLDAIPKRELFKFTTTNDGTSILIRKGK